MHVNLPLHMPILHLHVHSPLHTDQALESMWGVHMSMTVNDRPRCGT